MDHLNFESVSSAEMTQVEGGALWFAIFAIGVGIAAGRAKANEDAAQEASEQAAVLSALKQGGIIQ